MGVPLPERLRSYCAAVVNDGCKPNRAGWVISDGFIDSLDIWDHFFTQHPHLGPIFKLASLGAPAVPGIDLQPLAAKFGNGQLPRIDSQDLAASHFEVLEHLRSLLRSEQAMPLVVIHQPAQLDDFSQRILGALALEGTLRLVLHLSAGNALSARWQKLARNGQLISCPVLRVTAQEIPEICQQIRDDVVVPELSAISAYQVTGGELPVLWTLLKDVETSQLRRVLATGTFGAIAPLEQLTHRLRLCRVRLSLQIRRVLDICAVAGHLPLEELRALADRPVVDQLIGWGLLSVHSCAGHPVLGLAGSLIGLHWVGLLSAYEHQELRTGLFSNQGCCGIREIYSHLTAGATTSELSAQELQWRLELSCEQGNLAVAKVLAEQLKEHLATVQNPQDFQGILNTVARYTALTEGPYQALRMLTRTSNTYPHNWQDPASRELIVEIYLQTGRLLPTIQRIAQSLGIPAPNSTADPSFWQLLPEDELREHLRRGLSAASNANLRAAAVHFVAGLRKAQKNPDRGNARTLRTTFLSYAAYALALGGYCEQWEELRRYLHQHWQPWHTQIAAGWQTSLGVLQYQRGALDDGRRSLIDAAQCARLVNHDDVWEAGHAFQVWLDAQQLADEATSRQLDLPLNELLGFGRSTLEAALNQALIREHDALEALLPLTEKLQDPRGRAIRLSVHAELGFEDPRRVAQILHGLGQEFLCLWVIDGIVLRGMLAHRGDLPMPQSRRIEDLFAFTTELIRRCAELELEPPPAELVQILHTASEQSLAVLPFAASEAKKRKLTQREEEIFALVRAGESNRTIARKLTVSIRTVEGHIAAILDKYALSSRLLLSNVPVPAALPISAPARTT